MRHWASSSACISSCQGRRAAAVTRPTQAQRHFPKTGCGRSRCASPISARPGVRTPSGGMNRWRRWPASRVSRPPFLSQKSPRGNLMVGHPRCSLIPVRGPCMGLTRLCWWSSTFALAHKLFLLATEFAVLTVCRNAVFLCIALTTLHFQNPAPVPSQPHRGLYLWLQPLISFPHSEQHSCSTMPSMCHSWAFKAVCLIAVSIYSLGVLAVQEPALVPGTLKCCPNRSCSSSRLQMCSGKWLVLRRSTRRSYPRCVQRSPCTWHSSLLLIGILIIRGFKNKTS